MKQSMEKIQNNKKIATIIGGGIIVLLVVVFTVACSSGVSKFEELIDLGTRYLEEMKYEEAIVTFDSAIAIEPRDERGYIGKATAEYRLGRLDDAIETLTTAIGMVEDGTNLQLLLDEILTEWKAAASEENDSEEHYETASEESNSAASEGNYSVASEAGSTLWLNYAGIQLHDAKEFQVQMEVVGDEGNESNYTWTSSNEEMATVSSEGLVTVYSAEEELSASEIEYYNNVQKAVQDYVTITVQDSSGNTDFCWINRYYIKGVDEQQEADYTFRMKTEDSESPITVSIENDDDTSSVTLYGLSDYVYYSGDIVIPEQLTFQENTYSITTILENAFTYSTELTSVTIPSSVTSIDGSEWLNPFRFCSQLKTITVADENEFYQTIDDVLYSKDGKTLIAYPAQKEGETFEIPKEVEQIVPGALSGCTNLKEITVEEGNKYFESVDGVLIESKTKTILAYPSAKEGSYYETPDGVLTIGSYAFYNVQAEEIYVDSDVTQLEYSAFYECEKLTTLSGMESVVYISSSSIYNCNNLKYIGGGEGTTTIYFYQNKIELISPEKMINLQSLNLQIADGSDLSWLLEMSDLQQIYLYLYSVSDLDLDTLYQMNGLTTLYIYAANGAAGSVSEDLQKEIQEFIDSKTVSGNVYILGVSS